MANKKSKVNSTSNKHKTSKVETFTSNKSKTKAKSTGKQIDVKNNKTKAHSALKENKYNKKIQSRVLWIMKKQI